MMKLFKNYYSVMLSLSKHLGRTRESRSMKRPRCFGKLSMTEILLPFQHAAPRI